MMQLFLAAFATACVAQTDDRATAIVDAWSDWVAAGDTPQATIVVMRSGDIVAQTGIGIAADAAMPIASLSKAITAACVQKLSKTDQLDMDMTVGDVLDLQGPTASVTLAQLITHTSGIGPDSTQGNRELAKATTAQIQSIADTALDRDAQDGRVGSYAYNNENYAILGAVITQVTGEPYAQACIDAVMTPLDIQSATLTGDWAQHGSWGGWSISAPDYARFAWATFGPSGPIGAHPSAWPAASLDGGANYGMGVLWRDIQQRSIFWHAGMLCWDGAGDGGYFASYGGEWLVVTLYADCLAGTDRLGQLDQALFNAALR